jgi:hypothetical protein
MLSDSEFEDVARTIAQELGLPKPTYPPYKIPVCIRPEYTVYGQQIGPDTWVHCDVREWSPAILKRLRRDCDALLEMHGGPIYALNEPTGCLRHQHFLRVMGFRFFKAVPAKDGGECLMFRRDAARTVERA